MYTRVRNGKRYCTDEVCKGGLSSWDYIKQLLFECGFEEAQKASPREYIMKGCKGTILVYVKYHSSHESSIVFINSKDKTSSIKLNWEDILNYPKNGDMIFEEVRALWRAL